MKVLVRLEDGRPLRPSSRSEGSREVVEDVITYLTVDQVAMLLQMSNRWVYVEAQSGRLPAHRIGHKWRFVRDEIDAWVRSQ